ncbi:endonuclease/exonuclease/phosphatase family protein [Silicimonas sp. MF1-12-2]|uniref:endonuclease/exonuclease/phosphatase family protein n=1 Tax=Silicimonas sp. MF1-12-2 TaxID=3384793 RepID=UPI0039B4B8CD
MRDSLTDQDPQILAFSRVVHEANPDVLVLAGIDWDLKGHALAALADRIGEYPYRFSARPNRGIDSGLDLNGNGRWGEPDDAFGFGEFGGQEGLAVLSRLPFDREGWRDFSLLDWRNLPEALLLPGEGPAGRLSTTAHWDLPVILPDGELLNLLMWHATPPVFDGPEDRNGRRNHDETAFWLSYLNGAFGRPPRLFILLGAANLDPEDSGGRPEALIALLSDPRITDVAPRSEGSVATSVRDAGANVFQAGDHSLDTVDWPDDPGQPGNLRVDYILPSSNLAVTAAGVFWPEPGAPITSDVERASRHRLVWVDILLGTE